MSKREVRRWQTSLLNSSYHQARILLLVAAFAGKDGTLDGLTKLAKLDFLLRYPVFLERLAASGKVPSLRISDAERPSDSERHAVESRMMRYKYGPWDDAYYPIIGALVGRGLAEYANQGKTFALRLTPGGSALAEVMSHEPVWAVTWARCLVLRRAFLRTSGNRLKALIYGEFPDVVDRPLRTEI